MELNDRNLLSIVDTLRQQEHPDPIGFLARSELLTGLDNSFSDEGRIGATGIRQEDAERVGIKGDDIVSNFSAALKLDLDNASRTKDVADLHIAFLEGEDGSTKKRPKTFLRQLNKAKTKWDKRIAKLEERRSELLPEKKQEEPQEDNTAINEVAVNLAAAGSPEGVNEVLDLVEAPDLGVSGDAAKLEEIRGAFAQTGIESKSLPERRTSDTTENLRKVIREALKNAR